MCGICAHIYLCCMYMHISTYVCVWRPEIKVRGFPQLHSIFYFFFSLSSLPLFFIFEMVLWKWTVNDFLCCSSNTLFSLCAPWSIFCAWAPRCNRRFPIQPVRSVLARFSFHRQWHGDSGGCVGWQGNRGCIWVTWEHRWLYWGDTGTQGVVSG